MRLSKLAALSVALLIAGCPGTDEVAQKPTIKSFTATPSTVEQGGMAVLAWSVENATAIDIAINGTKIHASTETSGQHTVTVLSDTTFTLNATNVAGTVSQTVMVTVMNLQNPMIEMFSASPMAVTSGGDVTLSWRVTNSIGVDIIEGTQRIVTDGALEGTFVVRPAATTIYTLTAKGAGAVQQTATLTVTVVPNVPMVTSFTANPETVTDGESTTLEWTVINAETVFISDQNNNVIYDGTDLMGSVTAIPTASPLPGEAMFVLVATLGGPLGEDTRDMSTVIVNVNPVGGPRIVSFDAVPNNIALGGISDLSWNVSGATQIEISDGTSIIHTDLALNGTYRVRPQATTTYTLTARDAASHLAMASRTVTVSPAPPPIFSFAANPNPIARGATLTLNWETATATSVRITRDGLTIYETANNLGSYSTTANEDSADYALSVFNSLGSNTEHIQVYAHDAPVINAFTVNPLTFDTGFSVTATITWDVSSAAVVQLFANGVPVTGFMPIDVNPMTTTSSGTISVVVSARTDFTLFASSAAGQATQTITVAELFAKVEPNDTADLATAVVPGSVVQGAINPSGDVDWYSVQVPVNGWLIVGTSDLLGQCGTTPDTELAVYSTTTAADADRLAVNDDVGFGQYCSAIQLQELAGGTYYIRVRSSPFDPNGTFDYRISIDVGAAACGNGLFEASIGEECDDANTVNGDGCDTACLFEVNPTVIVPPSGLATVNLLGNGFQLVQVDVAVDGQSLAAVAADSGGTCDTIDTALALVDSTFQVLGSKADGGPSGAAGDCAAIVYPDDTFGVGLAAGTYYLAVFNQSALAGAIDVNVTYTDPACGNGVVTSRSGEQCDDGNTVPGDSCDATCQIELASLPSAATFVYPGAIGALGEHDFFPITVTAETYVVADVFVPDQATACTDDPAIAVTDSAQVRLDESTTGFAGSCARVGPNAATRLLPGTYYVEVWDNDDDGVIPAYEVTIASRPLDVCGNGAVETGEGCDDGNTTAGDGCNAICQPESTCDLALTAALGPNTGDTSLGFNSNTTLCDGYNQPGPEQVWTYTPATSGMLTIAMTSAADMSVYVRSPSCAVDTDTIDCEDLGVGGDTEELVVPVTAASVYFIIVDSYSANNYGPYTLELTQ